MINIYPLGDEIGRVEIIDSMGDDLRAVNAARVSMAKESSWDWHGELREKDNRLLRYLANHDHWTPFAHIMATLRIKMPIFVARQWFKHQVGFTRNEVSRRYVDDEPDFYIPQQWRLRAPSVKQGSSSETIESTVRDSDAVWYSTSRYRDLLQRGVAPEMARMVLPQSMYTEFYETASLAAYARLAKLRLDPHAQEEVRDYAEAVSALMQYVAPISWWYLMNAKSESDT